LQQCKHGTVGALRQKLVWQSDGSHGATRISCVSIYPPNLATRIPSTAI
jgi:hypothetical protein